MNTIDDVLLMFNTEKQGIYTRLNQKAIERARYENNNGKRKGTELGGHMAPGTAQALPSYFPSEQMIKNSFRKNVIEVIRNA